MSLCASQWEELFPKESWNKFPANELSVWSGVLQNKVGETPGYLQRDNLYQLKTENDLIDIYTGTAQINSKYLNQKVNLKGKLEEYELEGLQVREIFPTAIQLSE